jgi:voltage-gated potassium channel
MTTGPARPLWTLVRVVVVAAVRGVLTVAALVAAYYLLPLDVSGPAAVAAVAGGLVLVLAVIGWEIRAIMRSPHPAVRGVQSAAVVVPLFLLVFASAYYLISVSTPHSFTEVLDRTDSLYFTVTVFATVGFGDIAPVTTAARIVVTSQMIGDLLVLGVLLRVFMQAVRTSRARRDRENGAATSGAPDSPASDEADGPPPR